MTDAQSCHNIIVMPSSGSTDDDLRVIGVIYGRIA